MRAIGAGAIEVLCAWAFAGADVEAAPHRARLSRDLAEIVAAGSGAPAAVIVVVADLKEAELGKGKTKE